MSLCCMARSLGRQDIAGHCTGGRYRTIDPRRTPQRFSAQRGVAAHPAPRDLAYDRAGVRPIRRAHRALDLLVEQAVAEVSEVDVARDVIFAQDRVGRLAEEGCKAVDETHVACGRPVAPVPDLDAVPVAFHDIVRPGIDDEREMAIPLPA